MLKTTEDTNTSIPALMLECITMSITACAYYNTWQQG